MNYKTSEHELLEKTLKEYLKLNKKGLQVLDAMCGFWSYASVLRDYFGQENINELIGVDKELLNPVREELKEIPKLFNKPLKYLISKLEDLNSDYDDRFDLITNFRPQCTNDKMIKELMPAYNKMRLLLKKKGILFATTFNESEKNNLITILEKTGFKIKKVNKNKFDEEGTHHGWIITANH